MPELNETHIRNLYLKVLENYQIKQSSEFREKLYNAVVEMGQAYKPIEKSFVATYFQKPDYNNHIFCFAYILKYAALHTDLVQEMLQIYSEYRCRNVLKDILDRHGQLKLCCLGGGPGIDVIGLASFLLEERGLFKCSAVLVDEKEWQNTTWSVLHELRYGEYGLMSEFVEYHLKTSYLNVDLVEGFDEEVFEAINSANLITMVKFISAVNCNRSQGMIEKIFMSMKQGSFLLFIDNAAGGFYEMMSNTADSCDMTPLQEPLKHEYFHKDVLKLSLHGLSSCAETKVSVQIWRKTSNRTLSNFMPKRMPEAECLIDSPDFPCLKDSSESYRQSGFTEVPRYQKTVTLPARSTAKSNRNDWKKYIEALTLDFLSFLALRIWDLTVFGVRSVVEFFKFLDEWEFQ